MTGAVAAWERFWFGATPTSTLAILRIAFGLLMLGWGAALAPDIFTFFASDGMFPPGTINQEWGLLEHFGSDAALIGVYVALLVSAFCLMIGFGTRLAAAILFVTLLSFERRNSLIYNSGDAVVHNLAFFLVFAPSGASLSADRWLRARERFWEFPARAPWATRLIQIQLSAIYITSVWAKVRGETWNDGTAVSYALRIDDLVRFPIPHFVADTTVLVNLLTYGTLAIELGVAIFIWIPRTRKYAIAAGVLLHLAIDYRLEVGFFSYVMIVMYLAFLDPDAMSARLLRLRGALGRSRFAVLRRVAAVPGAAAAERPPPESLTLRP